MASLDRTFTVTQVNEYAKKLLERDPLLSGLTVSGEISNFKRHSSGHCYFTLKDAQSSVRCAFFKQYAMRNQTALRDGLQVKAQGYLTIYPRDGSYQLVVSAVESAGTGSLYELFEKRKRMLEQKGYFASARKRPLPAFIQHIAVVTSPTGAVLRDIVRVGRARFRGIAFTLFPVQVQGDGAARQIALAIEQVNAWGQADVIIVARGGGSLEDLWAFNELEVIEAIYSSRLPVVSAVGHETDFTLADFVADARASTPSNAAEICVPNASEMLTRIRQNQFRLARSIHRFLDVYTERLASVCARSVLQKPDAFIAVRLETLARLKARMQSAMQNAMQIRRLRVQAQAQKAVALGPPQVLKRGYSIIKRGAAIIRTSQALSLDDEICAVLADGQIKARVTELGNNSANV